MLFHPNHLSRSDPAGKELWGSSHKFRLSRCCSLPASAGRGTWVWVAGEEVPKVRAGSAEPVAELWELHFPAGCAAARGAGWVWQTLPWAGALQGFPPWCCSEGLVWKLGFGILGHWRAANGDVTLTHVGAKLPDLCDGTKLCGQEGGADDACEALQVDSGPCRVTLLGSRGI